MKKLFTLSFMIMFAFGITNAQTFWSEDFADEDDFFDWENEDLSGQGAIWTWCSGTAGPTESCPSIWDGGVNEQVPFASTTAENGFVTVDSDEYGGFPNNHLSQMTSVPISCAGRTNVRVEFQSHIGVFALDASTNAVFLVSNDGNTWFNFAPHPELLAIAYDPACIDTCRWSTNPSIIDFDISPIADGQDEVFLRWFWEGNFEYHWSVDDVRLYEDNPPVGISQVGDDAIGILISPMPVISEMRIQLSFKNNFERGEIQITNIIGDQIITQRLDSNLEQDLLLDLSTYASGIYFISVITDGKVNTKKFVLTN